MHHPSGLGSILLLSLQAQNSRLNAATAQGVHFSDNASKSWSLINERFGHTRPPRLRRHPSRVQMPEMQAIA